MSAKTPQGIPRQHWHCIWPQLFTARRKFNHLSRETENLPFIEYLARLLEKADEQAGEEDSDEDEIEDGDHVPSDGEEDDESCDEQSNVRRFMIGMKGEDDNLASRDQVDLVASFCEESVEANEREKRKPVALLDERTDPKNDLSIHVPEDEQHDAARRIVFITDLDSSSIEALVTTVALTPAPALQDLFYKHLASTASIGATIKSSGFQTFTFDFHIPYYVLRESKKSRRDIRQKPNGEPLRQFWELPSLSMPTSNRPTSTTDERYCLYEAVTSIGVTGNDHWTWTAYGFVDTYFDSRESVDGYHQEKRRPLGRPDPLANGQIDADEPLWDPREYFLKVVEIRTGLAFMEWTQILNKMEAKVKQSRTNLCVALSSNDPKASQEGIKLIRWNLHMTNFLRILGMKLSDTIAAWDSFRGNGIDYFNDYSVIPIETAFGKLKAHLQKLEALERELLEDNPDGLNVYLGLESIEALNSQQNSAKQVQIINIITTIIQFPLAVVAANLFSTTGVLQFTPTLPKLIFVFFSLGILILVALLALSNWRSWLHQMVEYNQKAITYYHERLEGKDASIIPPKVLKRAMFARRSREAALPEESDPEKGVKKD
ncbi:hypothetical protein IFR05_015849 [Cadophora sp. M221]|nr:hypothetical protein IFR05_015849 [Cadophora sp. M221]